MDQPPLYFAPQKGESCQRAKCSEDSFGGVVLIEIRQLHKSYNHIPVLTDVNLSVEQGSVMGLLGPNGAGKTTLISILTGVIAKDRGMVTIKGLDLDRSAGLIQSRCSYVPQTLAFYPKLTAGENLEYFGALWGLKGKKLKARMDFCIDIGRLEEFVDQRADKFSGGMQRRLNLAIGLLNDPEILYLDEPTVGVDTQSRRYILETIRRINRERRMTIVYTSHYMDEIEQVSDEIAVINGGRIVLHERKETILTGSDAVTIRADRLSGEAVQELMQIDGVRVEEDLILISRNGHFNETMARVFTLFQAHQLVVTDTLFGRRPLEEFFLALTDDRPKDDRRQPHE